MASAGFLVDLDQRRRTQLSVRIGSFSTVSAKVVGWFMSASTQKRPTGAANAGRFIPLQISIPIDHTRFKAKLHRIAFRAEIMPVGQVVFAVASNSDDIVIFAFFANQRACS